MLFDDPEWREWSDGEIARRCGVSQPFVSRQRGEWRARKSAEQRAEFQQQAASHNDYESSPLAAASAPRRCRRTGREHVMETAKIGKQRSTYEAPPKVIPDSGEIPPTPQGTAPADRITAAQRIVPSDLRNVQPHTWWRLGAQHLLCGPADHRFAAYVPAAPLALCGVRATAGDPSSAVAPEWIARRAVVALLLDNAALLTTRYPAEYLYRRTIAAMAPGDEEGRETWHPVALFAWEAHAIRILDVIRLATDPFGEEAPRADLAVQLLQHLTVEGDPVIAPALGDGATLFAAEATGRICWGAEPDPEQCGRFIRAGEARTGEPAYTSPGLMRGAV